MCFQLLYDNWTVDWLYIDSVSILTNEGKEGKYKLVQCDWFNIIL